MGKPKFWSSDKIVSISAMLISLITLFVFVYQTNLMRKQQYLSVMPYLSIANQGAGTENFSVVLKNDGLGPAFVESNKIIYRGKKYNMDLPDFLNEKIGDLDSVQFFYANIYAGKMIPPGEEIEIIDFQNNLEGVKAFYEVMDTLAPQLDFEMIYQSIYKERWLINNSLNAPVKQ